VSAPCSVPSRVREGECDRSAGDFSSAIALARPKSSSFTFPSDVTLTFAGFRSRWMIPLSWAASRASPICRKIVCPKTIRRAFLAGRLVPGHTREDSAGLVRARVGLQRILGLDHERGSKSVKELFQCAER